MLVYHLAVVGLLVGTEALFAWLSVLNVRHGEARLAERAGWVRERFGVDDVEELADYHRATTGLGVLRSVVRLAALLLVLYSGLFADAVAAVESLGLGPVPGAGLAFAAGTVALSVFGLPFDAVSTFVVEDLFGFNEQSPGLWARDAALQTAIAAVLAGVVGAALTWVVVTFPDTWALGGAALVLVFSLVLQVVYPRVIAPLFYEFDPVEAGELREAVEDVFERAGFACEQVYEMNASRRSSHSNAYFVGFGRTKRVVLFDTLVDQLDLPEVQSVLAHELAHWKRGHVWKGLAAGVLQAALLLGVAQVLVSGGVGTLFGVGGVVYGELVVALVVVAPLNRLLAPLSNRLSLAHEREADDFAARVTDGATMASALTTIGAENLSNPFPHPHYAAFHHAHPPVPERVARLVGGDGPAPDEEAAADATAGD